MGACESLGMRRTAIHTHTIEVLMQHYIAKDTVQNDMLAIAIIAERMYACT